MCRKFSELQQTSCVTESWPAMPYAQLDLRVACSCMPCHAIGSRHLTKSVWELVSEHWAYSCCIELKQTFFGCHALVWLAMNANTITLKPRLSFLNFWKLTSVGGGARHVCARVWQALRHQTEPAVIARYSCCSYWLGCQISTLHHIYIYIYVHCKQGGFWM